MHVQHVLSSIRAQVRRAPMFMCLPNPVFCALRNTSSLSSLTAANTAVCGCSTGVAAYLSGITQAAAGAGLGSGGGRRASHHPQLHHPLVQCVTAWRQSPASSVSFDTLPRVGETYPAIPVGYAS